MLESHPTLRFRDIAQFKANNPWPSPKNAVLHFTYNARGAIYQLLRSLPGEHGKTVLLPAFHCYAAVEPVVRAGYRPVFYRIREDLSLDQEDLCAKLSSDVAAALIIHYCGFPANLEVLIEQKKHHQFLIIEDWAHSFLVNEQGALAGGKGDVSIFSFYKLVPSYTGGCLRIDLPGLDCLESNRRLSVKRTLVAIKRLTEQVIENSGEGVLRSAFRYLESRRVKLKRGSPAAPQANGQPVSDSYLFDNDLAFVRMPWFARAILRASDIREVVSARRRNFEILNSQLQENSYLQKVFRSLPDNVCPWAYPVIARNRSRYDHLLRDRGVPVFTFGELLHPALETADPAIREPAEFLSQGLMMLPLHQNLDAADMESICQTVNAFFASPR
jgi:dTDP-4-amino-4,6-dideoxygalactose transaminase